MSYLRHRLTARGGGHGIHSPFVYELCENVFYNNGAFYDFRRLASLRDELMNDRRTIDTGNFGAGSRKFGTRVRKVADIARHGITPQRQNECLYRLANHLGIQTSIELGTSLGLNALYLAKQNPAGSVITVEGSEALSTFAKNLAENNGVRNIRFVTARFEEVLPELTAQATEPVLVYIDGDHTRAATLRIFELLSPLARGNNVFVFDDIYWSRGMTQAWRAICADERVRLSIDTFESGYLFFREGFREKVHCRLSV